MIEYNRNTFVKR